jgi:hypothetical protein
MTSSSRPRKITLRAYQVGFGDCFLLTFHYGDEGSTDNRHILIDCGSTETPDGAPQRSAMLRRIAEDISGRSGGKLYAIVATHRHADHINGFATQKGKGSGDILAKCDPDFVLQPWTEDPKAPADPLAAGYGSDRDRRAFFASLDSVHDFCDRALAEVPRLQRSPGCNSSLIEQLRLFATNNRGIKDPANKSALENLTAMGAKNGRALYLSYGQAAGLDLPGVTVKVLGPPTLDQSRAILQQRESNPDEYWQFYLTGAADGLQRFLPAFGSSASNGIPIFNSPATRVSDWAPQHTRWFIRRLNALRGDQLLRLVRTLDGVLNNTSLILLFSVLDSDQKLLFPGDAQWENWSFALQHPQDKSHNEELLRGVTVYKVGHHGSRNATPKSMWKLIKSPDLQSVLSTKAEKHGHAESQTEVPRATLVEELRKSHLFSTQDLPWPADAKAAPPSEMITITPHYTT